MIIYLIYSDGIFLKHFNSCNIYQRTDLTIYKFRLLVITNLQSLIVYTMILDDQVRP